MPWPIERLRHGLTLGAQGAVIDQGNRVLLVRHSYRPGWFFPGGGVEWHEAVETALARELEEEVGVSLAGPPLLHGVFANFASFPGDHIALFVVRNWQRRDDHANQGEIAEAQLFGRDELPERTDPGTRLRLAEIFDGVALSPMWWGPVPPASRR
jgi:ADP-ribose pyrophosphatase YjhB (NUDIX family)